MADVLVREVSNPLATALLLPGIGLGPWLWEPWLPFFEAERVNVIAPRLPGHGDGQDPRFEDLVAFVHEQLVPINGPVALVGHSMGGLVAQAVAARRELHALVLVCPMLPGQIWWTPPLRTALSLAPKVLTGQPLKVPWRIYREQGLELMDEATARMLYDKVVPWPARLSRDLIPPPRVDPDAITAPTLITLGAKDLLIPWNRGRLLGDLYEGTVWRYDDLAHMPCWEPGGERMGKDVAHFCAEPHRPKVLESEGYTPTEGVGHDERRKRRGEAMKKRSAYGQKEGARK